MHKNYRLLISLSLLSLTISACNLLPSAVTRKKSESISSSFPEMSQRILRDDRFDSVHIFGDNYLTFNNEKAKNSWGKNSNNAMQAISLNDLAKIDVGLALTLSNKEILGLYKYEDLLFKSLFKAGWTNLALVDGRVVEYNGSYVFKGCGLTSNSNGDLIESGWFPSPEFHGESLTPDTLFITDNMSSRPDQNGFDENSNPVALQDGTFTAILATYGNKEGKNAIVCGLGLVKTSE